MLRKADWGLRYLDDTVGVLAPKTIFVFQKPLVRTGDALLQRDGGGPAEIGQA